jgi:WD40 repeat protein
MAPEQAEGKTRQVGPLADVYALGAILYELVTGRPPFRGATVLETLEQVKTAEPVPPSRLVPGLPRDVETIALKCLQKEPGRRYDSVSALADDLGRFLGGEPIVARPVPPWERALKWTRRRPALAALVVAVPLLLASLLGLGIWSYAEIDRSLTRAERLAGTEARANAKAQEQTKIANRRAEELTWEDYVNRVNRAYREVQDDNVALAEDLLHGCPIERRGWEWHYVKRLCHAERLSVEVLAGNISAIAYSPDGRFIATGAGGQFSRGKRASRLELWDRQTGQRQPTLHRTENVIWSLAFSPDGTRLALGGTNPQIEVRDMKTGELLWTKSEPQLPQAMSVAFSHDGTSLAAGFGLYSNVSGRIFKVALYEATNGREVGTVPSPKGGANDLAFHPDGRRVAVAGSEVVEVWDVVTRTKVHALRGHSKWVYCLAFSPDGRWLATGGWDRTVKLRAAGTGEEQVTIFGHQGFVLDLAFSPDSRSLATTSEDRSVRLWEVPSGRQIGTFHGHTDFVQAVAFAPDGRELASGSLEGTLKVWDRRTSLPVVFNGHTGWVVRLALRKDGRRVVSEAGPFRSARETTMGWDPVTGVSDPALTGVFIDALRDEYLPPSSFPFWVAPPPVTSPDGTRLARAWAGAGGIPAADRSQAYSKSSAMVLDAATGRVLHSLVGHTADLVGIAFSPDGRRIATASLDRTIKLWDTATGREVFTLRGHTAGVLELAFSPDGGRIISGGIDLTARVRDGTPLPADVLLAQEARYQQKREALSRLVKATEDAQRAQTLAREGLWDLATAALGELVEQEPDNPGLRYPHIRSLVEAGDRAGVRRACEELIKRYDVKNAEMQARSIVWSCVLVPDAVADQDAPVRLAESYIADHPEGRSIEKSDGLSTLGAALYRAGRCEEAIRRLDKGIQARGDGGDPKGFAFLAMAHQRLGHRDEARRWLDKLASYQPQEGSDFSWNDLDIRILRREAESLILGSRSPAPSPTTSEPTKEAAADPGAQPE